MALFVSSYRSRQEILADATHINWADEPFSQVSGGDRWEGRRTEIVEGGHLFGSSAAVLWLGRENVDAEQDVPAIGPTDANLVSKSWTKKFDGINLVRIQGELWRSEWVDPASNSPRVRGDKLPTSVFFVTDAEGTRQAGDALEATGGWLMVPTGEYRRSVARSPRRPPMVHTRHGWGKGLTGIILALWNQRTWPRQQRRRSPGLGPPPAPSPPDHRVLEAGFFV